MQKTSYSRDESRPVSKILPALLLVILMIPAVTLSAQTAIEEKLSGFYAREGNSDSPAMTSRNNIYIKFFDDRWVGMMFIPYPYAIEVEDRVVSQVFEKARKHVSSAAILRGKYGLLSEPATIQIERYGYLEDRIVFECGALSPCTIRLRDEHLELIKPGVINEHIVKYNHVATP